MSAGRADQILAGLARDSGSGMESDLPGLLVRACAAALSVTGAGLVWMTNDGPGGMLAATDGPALVLEELQFTLGEGPCIESSVLGRPVLQPRLAVTAPVRWPGFAAGALEAGVKAVFAFPLQIGGIRVGVLDLYRDAEGDLETGELAEALAFADAAVSILLHLQAQVDPGEVHPVVGAGLSDRSEVHQATGMISGQLGVPLVQALAMLRAHAYAAERPILAVARDVVSRALNLAD